MDIQTKFNVGEKAFAIINDKIEQVRIHQIIINVMSKTVKWEGDKYDKRHENDVYKTKEDIIK